MEKLVLEHLVTTFFLVAATIMARTTRTAKNVENKYSYLMNFFKSETIISEFFLRNTRTFAVFQGFQLQAIAIPL